MKKREGILALGLCGAVCLATNTGLAAQSWSSVTMKPLQVASSMLGRSMF